MTFPTTATSSQRRQQWRNPQPNAAPHRKNAAQRNRSDSPYQQRTTQSDNPTQLLIKQAVDYLMQQLEAGHSETLAAYLGSDGAVPQLQLSATSCKSPDSAPRLPA